MIRYSMIHNIVLHYITRGGAARGPRRQCGSQRLKLHAKKLEGTILYYTILFYTVLYYTDYNRICCSADGTASSRGPALGPSPAASLRGQGGPHGAGRGDAV